MPAEPAAGRTDAGQPRRHRWAVVRRAAFGALLLAVAVLLVRHAREVDWPAVAAALRDYAPATLLLAGMAALGSHALYGCYDLVARSHLRLPLPPLRVFAIACVSYAFNLNLGALVGGVAVRFRLYARQGLAADTIAQVVALSMVSNWLGYMLLFGIVWLVWPLPLPEGWRLDAGTLRLLGVLPLLAALGYLLWCARRGRRVWQLGRWRLPLPSGRVAVLQLGVSGANWMLIAGVLTVLLPAGLGYTTVLGVLLLAAVAGVLAHVPAGLGVIEAVFIALLSSRVPLPQLLAALLAYRALYYFVPLGLALAGYVALEWQARRAAPSGSARPPGTALAPPRA